MHSTYKNYLNIIRLGLARCKIGIPAKCRERPKAWEAAVE
jgi:hypothetical protein